MEEALAVVPGPKGIALACFASGSQEISGLTNDALGSKTGEVEGEKDGKGTKRKLQDIG